MRDRDALPLGERLEVEAAVEAAFAPLRERRTDLSPLRVRAAVRWGRGGDPEATAGRGAPAALKAPAALRWSGAIARLSELSVAVGMSVMIFGAALGPALGDRGVSTDSRPAPVQVQAAGASLEEQQEIRATRTEWLDSLRARLDALRVDRYIPFQDWLDPMVVRPLVRRLDVPAPRSDVVGQSGLY